MSGRLFEVVIVDKAGRVTRLAVAGRTSWPSFKTTTRHGFTWSDTHRDQWSDVTIQDMEITHDSP